MAVADRSFPGPGDGRRGERVVSGPARLGRRTKRLVKRLAPGEVAVIDHKDLDRVSAEDLVAAGVVAVLNCRPSSSGEYPNMGPLLLIQAGVHLVDLDDDALFDGLDDGQPVEIVGGEVHARGTVLARGRVQEPADVLAATERRRREIGEALEAFARNTVEHMVEERELLSGKIELPRFETDFRDKDVMIVVRGVGHERDIAALRPYIRDMRPVLVGVDGGANALLEAGFRPDMIVGDMDSAAEATLRSGAELIVHAYTDGRAPGGARLDRLGVPYTTVRSAGTSEDVAFLLAHEKRAELIVAVGTHGNLREFLDKGRSGMSSTFLVRLRVGEILVDAKGVSRIYGNSRLRARDTFLLIGSALLTMLVVVTAISPSVRLFFDLAFEHLREWFVHLKGLV